MRRLSPEEIKQRDAALQRTFRDSLEQVAHEKAERARTHGDAVRVAPWAVLLGAFLGYRAGLQPGGLPVVDVIIGACTGGALGAFVGVIVGIWIHRPPAADLIEQTNARWRRAILRAFIGGSFLGLIAGWSEGLRFGIIVASSAVALFVAIVAFFDARFD